MCFEFGLGLELVSLGVSDLLGEDREDFWGLGSLLELTPTLILDPTFESDAAAKVLPLPLPPPLPTGLSTPALGPGDIPGLGNWPSLSEG